MNICLLSLAAVAEHKHPFKFSFPTLTCTSFQRSLSQRPFLIKSCDTASDCLLDHAHAASSMSPFFHQSMTVPCFWCSLPKKKKKSKPQKGWAAIGHAITRQTHKKSIKACLLGAVLSYGSVLWTEQHFRLSPLEHYTHSSTWPFSRLFLFSVIVVEKNRVVTSSVDV